MMAFITSPKVVSCHLMRVTSEDLYKMTSFAPKFVKYGCGIQDHCFRKTLGETGTIHNRHFAELAQRIVKLTKKLALETELLI